MKKTLPITRIWFYWRAAWRYPAWSSLCADRALTVLFNTVLPRSS